VPDRQKSGDDSGNGRDFARVLSIEKLTSRAQDLCVFIRMLPRSAGLQDGGRVYTEHNYWLLWYSGDLGLLFLAVRSNRALSSPSSYFLNERPDPFKAALFPDWIDELAENAWNEVRGW
jgi:hypothetical protein